MSYRILRWAGIPVAWIDDAAIADVTITTRRTVRVHHVDQVEFVHDFRQEVTHTTAAEITAQPEPAQAIRGRQRPALAVPHWAAPDALSGSEDRAAIGVRKEGS